MTTIEISDKFDTYCQEYLTAAKISNPMFGFNEYEKSVFLTQSEYEIFNDFYNGNGVNIGYDITESFKKYMTVFNSEATLKPTENTGITLYTSKYHSLVYKLPDDLMYIIHELGTYTNNCNNTLDVYPTTHDKLDRTIQDPFKCPTANKALRIESVYGDRYVELITLSTISDPSYIVRYIRKPKPIILVDLSTSDLSINGKQNVMTSEFDDTVTEQIIRVAVQKAIQSRASVVQAMQPASNNSESDNNNNNNNSKQS